MDGQTRILVTAFQPFQGRPVNGSTTLLRWLRRRWSRPSFASAIFPVDWQKAPSRLAALITRYQPTAVLSLGEGSPHQVAWEGRSANAMSGADEAGQLPRTAHIHANGPAWLPITLPTPSTGVFALLPRTTPLVHSQDAGTFLCNRILWEALRRNVERVGFLHFPPQGNSPNRAYLAQFSRFLQQCLMEIYADLNALDKASQAT